MSQESGQAPAAPAEQSQSYTSEAIDEAASNIAGDESAEELEASDDLGEGEELEASSEEEVEAQKEEIKQLKKKLKLKVDGQEIEEEIDFEDDEALIKQMQKARAFDKKAQESATYRKQMEGLLSALQDNPAAVLQELGMDVNELAYNQLQQYLEDEQKSPEQKEAEQMKARLEELEKERQQLQEEKQQAVEERLRDEAASEIQEDILSALTDHKGVLSADDPEAIGDIARALYRYAQAGQDVQVQDVIKTVEKRYVEKLRKRAEAWDESKFNEVFGKKKMNELRTKRVRGKKATTQTAKQVADSGKTAPKEPAAPEKKLSYKDFFKTPGR
jgi:hypothetical protein